MISYFKTRDININRKKDSQMKNKFLNRAFLLAVISLFLFACEEGPNFKDYTYPVPVPEGLTPTIGYPGSYVIIKGSSFGIYTKAVSVFFNGIEADSIISCIDDQIKVKVPDGAVSGKVSLIIWTNTIDSIGSYTVLPPSIVSGVTPQRGKAGEVATITGEKFGANKDDVHVFIGDAEAEVISVSDNEIKFTIPDAKSGLLVLHIGSQVITSSYFLIGDELVTGTLIGHEGSWGNNSATFITAAVDGDITTFVDAATKTGYVGYDVGLGKAAKLTSVRYVPRESHPQRMINGEIRGANDPTLSDYVTLYTITTEPPKGVYTEVEISTEESYRYIYYYSPDGYCNIAEIEFYGNIVDAVIPEGKYTFEFDDPTSTSWIPQQNATYVIENSKLKVTFDPVQFTGTNKRRADLKYMETPWIYNKEYPILAIKFTKPATVAFRPDITGLDSGFSNNDYQKDFEANGVYYWNISEKTTKDRVECGVFQFKIPDITSDETGYDVDWVRTFKSVDELSAFVNK